MILNVDYNVASTSILRIEKAQALLEYNPGKLIILRTETEKLFSSP